MAQPAHIAFLGFGEAARAFCWTLGKADPALKFSAYDIKLGGPEASAMSGAMARAGVTVVNAAEGLADADWIVSAVTADQSLEAIGPLVPALGPGTLVIDINSVSPGRKRQTAELICATGAAYLDMAVMSPVHPKGHASPVLLAGQGIDGLRAPLDRLGFAYDVAGDEPGAATAIKMVRSLFVKGLEAITVETLLAAEASGCRDVILSSLAASYPGLEWPALAGYNFERTLRHGARRAVEMEESAATLDALGLNGGLAREIAAVQRAQGAAGAASLCGETLHDIVANNLRARMKACPRQDDDAEKVPPET
ncbi:MAG: DUF1932 domain-containing protein [Rhizobiaceae bacterium]